MKRKYMVHCSGIKISDDQNLSERYDTIMRLISVALERRTEKGRKIRSFEKEGEKADLNVMSS